MGNQSTPGKRRDPRVSVRVALVILIDGKLLLALHEKAQRRYWVFPGGRLQYGETLEECGHRELVEEANIHVRIGSLLYVTDRKSDGCQDVGIYFRGYPADGDLDLGGDPESPDRRVLKQLALVTDEEFRDLVVLPPEVQSAVRDDWAHGFSETGRYLGHKG